MKISVYLIHTRLLAQGTVIGKAYDFSLFLCDFESVYIHSLQEQLFYLILFSKV